ncbi:MAG TPA: hypothetical protein PKL15_18090, partial [Saprospiraceae bacterium]|nr:hypothetical protein [Saprospiraceae bacterium]
VTVQGFFCMLHELLINAAAGADNENPRFPTIWGEPAYMTVNNCKNDEKPAFLPAARSPFVHRMF